MTRIQIVDRTLSCLDDYEYTSTDVREWITLLDLCDADVIEMSVKCFRTLGELPPFGSYLLRVDDPEEADSYPAFSRFVCHRKADESRGVSAEIRINDPDDVRLLTMHRNDRLLRVTGLDDLYRHRADTALAALTRILPRDVEFCPGNSFGCATAIAAEWLTAGCGNRIVTSFGGVGGFAPFEEILVSLRHLFRRHPQTAYEMLPRMRELFERITGQRFDARKPIIGDEIFSVESGIHIGGILKHPKCYEPFPPETVGQTREFRYGRYSGKRSVRHKLDELGIRTSPDQLVRITRAIKDVSKSSEPLTDQAILELIHEIIAEGGTI